MGNRAIVRFGNEDKHGIYLHWNGGPESVLAFLEVMRERKWLRMDYASARFTGVVCEFFDANGDDDSGLSLGIFDDFSGDVGDNGLYMVESLEPISVSQNGKKITSKSLDKDDKKRMQEIIDLLSQVRLERSLAAQKRGFK